MSSYLVTVSFSLLQLRMLLQLSLQREREDGVVSAAEVPGRLPQPAGPARQDEQSVSSCVCCVMLMSSLHLFLLTLGVVASVVYLIFTSLRCRLNTSGLSN